MVNRSHRADAQHRENTASSTETPQPPRPSAPPLTGSPPTAKTTPLFPRSRHRSRYRRSPPHQPPTLQAEPFPASRATASIAELRTQSGRVVVPPARVIVANPNAKIFVHSDKIDVERVEPIPHQTRPPALPSTQPLTGVVPTAPMPVPKVAAAQPPPVQPPPIARAPSPVTPQPPLATPTSPPPLLESDHTAAARASRQAPATSHFRQGRILPTAAPAPVIPPPVVPAAPKPISAAPVIPPPPIPAAPKPTSAAPVVRPLLQFLLRPSRSVRLRLFNLRRQCLKRPSP